MVVAYVYALHLEDGDYRYIGICVDPKKRMREHRHHASKGTTYPVYRWMRKHENEVYMTVIAVTEDYEQAKVLEIYWIAEARSSSVKMLNMTDGGDGTIGYKYTEEQIANARIAHTGGHLSEQHKAKISAANKGRVKSPSERANISASHKGRVITEESRKK